MYKLGYNTNGLVHHRWDQALELIAETGYTSVAITIDHHCLNPFSNSLAYEVSRMRKKLEERRSHGAAIRTFKIQTN